MAAFSLISRILELGLIIMRGLAVDIWNFLELNSRERKTTVLDYYIEIHLSDKLADKAEKIGPLKIIGI